ncbi:MAG: pyridoxamine 5'-phosphate oxidase family protein [Flavipsychrobacter sp.]|nr:pyridoxamine 5'-phosphate oxidase family protein [Flavipsychrobacter sp.]
MLGELTETEIGALLERNIIGRLGCNDGTNSYVVPISYVFMGDHILCHSYEGLKIAMMRANPNVCFEVDEIRDYSNWRCVIAWGVYLELSDKTEIENAKQYFSEEMLELKVSETALPPDAQPERPRPHAPGDKQSIYYKIVFTAISGRYEQQI